MDLFEKHMCIKKRSCLSSAGITQLPTQAPAAVAPTLYSRDFGKPGSRKQKS